MEPADMFKITMSVEEARAELEHFPEVERAKDVPRRFLSQMQIYKLTPTQAQAALVLAWNDALKLSHCCYPPLEEGN